MAAMPRLLWPHFRCYSRCVLSPLRRHRRYFAAFAVAGLALRLLFFVYYPSVTDDSRVYADFAVNWLQHGTYGQTEAAQVVATDTRLPGYPAFLAVMFALFGAGNFQVVLLAQILIDLATCFVVADLARRVVSDRAARVAFALAALCPFLANYAVAGLTETLEIFFTALAMDCVVAGLDGLKEDRNRKGAWVCAGLATGASILLRPDGGIVLAGIGFYLAFVLWQRWRGSLTILPIVKAGIWVAVLALAPLVPWTVRNFRTLHHFQPLAPRYATESEEFNASGFNRWVKTWMAEYASVEEIYWNVPGEAIDEEKLPARAFDSVSQQERTVALIADYNQTQELTRELDSRFEGLAAERIQVHPLRYYVILPIVRVADMWLRPRTELLPPDPRWWEFDDDPKASVMAVALGVINLLYIGAAVLGLCLRRASVRYLGLLLGFVLLRSAFLGTLENPEPRYTLECYPIVMVLAASLIRGCQSPGHDPYQSS